ncbi:MAG: Ig-like domain-containing protein [Ignisphaera sp.]
MSDRGNRVKLSLLSILISILVSMNLLSSSIASLTVTEGSLIISSGNSVGWRVVAEGSSVSRYEFALSCVANALRLILYMDSGGDINKDGIKMVIEGATIAIPQDSVIEYRSSVIGYTRIGYEGDGKGTAKGLHVIYYIFPNTTYIQLIKLELYSEHGYPRLYTDKSLIEPVNITMFYWSLKDEKYSYGTYYVDNVNQYNGELKVATVSHGVPTEIYKDSSGVSYYYGRAFKPDMFGAVDIYVDIGYMGGYNTAPEGTYGLGKYTIKLDVGIEQSSRVDSVVSDLDYETLFYEEGGGGILELVAGVAADRVEDMLFDLVTDYGINFVASPIGRAILRYLPYVSDIIEWIEMVASLTYDKIINGSKRVVFANSYIKPSSEDLIYIWTHFIGLSKSMGLSTTIINFCGNPPWENFLDRYFGLGVWRLNYGGIYVGGIVLDYFNVPEVVSELPHGAVYPATVNISIKFSKPIDRGSLPPYINSITVYLNSAEVPFFEYFRYSLSSDNTTLFIYPSYHLEYGSNYLLILTRRIRGSDGSNIARSYEIEFNTEHRRQMKPEVYYVLPTVVKQYEMKGVLFNAYLYSNVSIDWGRATVSNVMFNIDGIEVKGSYVGEATFYTNDIWIDYYDGGFGRLYIANGSLWFTPLMAKDGGFPPKRGVYVFKIGEQANIIHSQPARLVVSRIKGFGNPKVSESLKNIGIVEGAVFDLEPMPIANYEIMSIDRLGEGIILSEDEPELNNTKIVLYIVTADDVVRHGLDKLIDGYKPMYSISLGGMSPLPIDIFVFIIANVTYMRAWRLAPLGYTSYIEHQKMYTYTIKFPSAEPMEIMLIANETIKSIDSSSLPNKIKLVAEGTTDQSGCIIFVIPKKLGLTIRSAVISGGAIGAIEPREVNETPFNESVGIRLTYKHMQRDSIITVYLSSRETAIQTSGDTYFSVLVLVTLISIAVIAIVVWIILKFMVSVKSVLRSEIRYRCLSSTN